MNRYKVFVSIYVDAKTEGDADDMVTSMLCGLEPISGLWSVDTVEKQWEHCV
jgi:hypothetical protein